MAEKSGFFNSLIVDGDYDRKYNADDYSENLAVIISNGVLRSSNDDLKVTASGLVVTVGVGRGWINGHWYKNSTPLSLAAITAPVGGSRYDRVMLRYDNTLQERKISVVYVEGVASNNPTPPTPTRNDNVYDLVLANIYITANAQSVTVTDMRSNKNLCGWIYSVSGDGEFFESLDTTFYDWFEEKKDTLSSVTLFKRYQWKQTLNVQTSSITFNIPQYDAETCFFEVYVNGILETRYTHENNVITFLGLPLVAGTVVTVNVYKSIDGTGIESVADEITELQNTVATLVGVSRYTYNCTGTNDNISISQICEALNRGIYDPDELTPAALAFMQRYGNPGDMEIDAQITVDITGTFGASTPFSGSGTSVSPYRWIALDAGTDVNGRKVCLDFGKCQRIYFECSANTYNSIFYGAEINVKNANVYMYAQPTGVFLMAFECAGNRVGAVNVENCDIRILTTDGARIAEHGTFTNCYCECVSENGAAYCFKPKNTGLIRLIGGTYFAYGTTASGIGSAIIHTSASETDAVLLAYNIHAPVSARSGYSQGFLSVANAGNTLINGVVSRLTSSGSYNEIIGQINKNKA